MTETHNEKHEIGLVRSILSLTGIVLISSIYSLADQALSEGLLTISTKWQFALWVLGIITLVVLGLVISAFTTFARRIVQARKYIHAIISRLGSIRFLGVLLLIVAPSLLFLQVNEQFLTGLAVRVLMVWVAVVVATELIVAPFERQRWLETAIGITIGLGVTYRLSLLMLFVNNYPLTLGWSEGSRYYYASLFFSRRLYGEWLNPSVLHPTRYLLQGLAFLLPQAGLWFHRFWQVLLWLLTTGATGFLLARRFHNRTKTMTLFLIGFSILYLFQGPVYYYLLVMVALILGGFNRNKLKQVSLLVLLGSIWAGTSRINWYPMPGILAATLYLLEVSRSKQSLRRYWSLPVLWVVLGTTLAFVSQVVYVFWSGNPVDQFSSSFTSSMLWYRLFPNATFSLGILPAITLVSFPALAIIWRTRRGWASTLKRERYFPILGMLALLLLGGIIVSLKIGGGSNLHNLDGYLVILGIVASYAYLDHRILGDNDLPMPMTLRPTHYFVLLLIPMMFNLSEGQPLLLPATARVEESMLAIQTQIQQVGIEDRDILFISQRHLLTFDKLGDVPLIPEYETVFLMEMAMSENRIYLDEFHRKLRAQQFDLIIVEPLSTTYQSRERGFSEENNAWVQEVSEPVLCYYNPVQTFNDTHVQILRPRIDPCE